MDARLRSGTPLAATLLGALALHAAAQPCDLVATPLPAIREAADGLLVYDRARSSLVSLWATDQRSTEAGVWEHVAGAWTPMTALPDSRAFGKAAVYDRARRETFVFGASPNDPVNIAFAWDGRRLTTRPADGIPPRYQHAMAFDARRGVSVLYGGAQDGNIHLSDTWEWDGQRWALREADSPPGPRSAHAMAYDSARGVTVLHGGGNRFTFRQTWEWDGRDWALAHGDGPQAGRGDSMVFDEARGVAVLLVWISDGQRTEIETWEWDGTDWHLAAIDPHFTNHPTQVAYDEARGAVVVAGADRIGRSAGALWAWDGAAWTLAEPGTPVGSLSLVAADTRRERIVAANHCNPCPGPHRTWEWDGRRWTLPAAEGPPARRGGALVYDEARSQTLLFGGERDGEYLDDLWAWDGAAWTPVPASGPGPRTRHAMAYDTHRRVAVLFGGSNGARFNDTWEWDGAAWTIRSVAGPSPRERAAMAYDPESHQTILFGGNDGSTDRETWAWDGARWRQLDTRGPHVREPALAFDPSRRRVVLHNGENGEFWTWEGDGWVLCAETDAVVGTRSHALAHDPATGGLLMVLESTTWLIERARDCPPDFDRDGVATGADVLVFLNAWTAGDPRADLNGDGTTDTQDVLLFLNLWNAGC
jgi:hypothetical protein